MTPQIAHDALALPAPVDLDADEDVRHAGVRDTVVELRDVAAAERGAELLEAARPLGNGHREHRLAMLAELGLLGDEAQPVEIGIRPRGDRDARLAARAMALDPRLGAGVRLGGWGPVHNA